MPDISGEWGPPAARREVVAIGARMRAGKPRAGIEPLNYRPKASHQDSNNACTRVASHESGYAVIVVEVDPSSRPSNRIGAAI